MDRRKVTKALSKKGFREDPDLAKRDHIWYRLYLPNGQKTTIATTVSRGTNSDLGDPLVKSMATQLQLRNQEFKQLVDCSLSGEGYLAKLREAGKL